MLLRILALKLLMCWKICVRAKLPIFGINHYLPPGSEVLELAHINVSAHLSVAAFFSGPLSVRPGLRLFGFPRCLLRYRGK